MVHMYNVHTIIHHHHRDLFLVQLVCFSILPGGPIFFCITKLYNHGYISRCNVCMCVGFFCANMHVKIFDVHQLSVYKNKCTQQAEQCSQTILVL